MKKALVVGGANGIGLSIAVELAKREDIETVSIVDKVTLSEFSNHSKIKSFVFDLTNEDYSFFDRFEDIDTLMITAGFGKLSLFKNVSESYIKDSFAVNTIPSMRLIHRFYYKLEKSEKFYCGVMGSIAGFMSSPFFSVYAATKAALKIFIESVNVELKKGGFSNRILNVSPGSIKGTSFTNGKTDLSQVTPLAKSIIEQLEKQNDLYIPQYEDVYKNVLARYYADFRAEGEHSYEYKIGTGRVERN